VGASATIVCTVWAWNTGSSDYADFYYTSNAKSPEWQYIGTKQPSRGGSQEIEMPFTIPEGTNQAVRYVLICVVDMTYPFSRSLHISLNVISSPPPPALTESTIGMEEHKRRYVFFVLM
jgi:hypothetical protein